MIQARTAALRDLVAIGKARGMWHTNAEAARALGIPAARLRTCIAGRGALDEVDALVTTLRERIGAINAKTRSSVSPQGDSGQSAPDSPTVVVEGFWFDALKSGLLTIPNQENERTRFLLPASCFMTLRGQLTRDERSDTNDLIRTVSIAVDELSRRLSIAAQLESADERHRLVHRLSRNLDELIAVIRIARDTIPTEAAARFEEEAQLFREMGLGALFPRDLSSRP